jgi:hypothetical protein
MTASYHLILPMPAGRTGPNRGVLSVAFVPRLQGIGVLGQWQRDWSNWPRVVNGTALGPSPVAPSAPPLELNVGLDTGTGSFVVRPFNTGLTVTSLGKWLTKAPSADAWAAVFGTGAGSIRVDRFRPIDPENTLAPMYDAGAMADRLRVLHRTLAVDHVDGPPTVQDIGKIPAFNAINTAIADYEAFMEPLGDGDVSGESTPAEADFHQAIGYLMAHPELLRFLGLVVDLEVEIPPVPPLGPAEFRLVVESNFEASYPLGKTVPIVIDVSPDFWPVAVSGQGPGRWASIGNALHRVESLDIDRGVAGFANLSDGDDPGSPTAPTPLHTAGLYVTRQPGDLVAEIEHRWDEQRELEQQISGYLRFGTPIEVKADAEVLVAGRRYDVFDEQADRWFSLWQREVPNGFVFPRNAALSAIPDPDEGWMTTTAFTEAQQKLVDPVGVDTDPPANPNPSPGEIVPGFPAKLTPAPPWIDQTPLRVSPVLFSWRGWSLAANPPVRGFSGLNGPTDLSANAPTDEMLVKVVVDYEVPDGVLPRLRYTHRYKFRARVVDLAGNSRTLAETNVGTATETPLIRFGRTSPIGPPIPVRREPRPVPGWADTTTTLVIKSELAQADATVIPTSRLLFPSQTDQYQCELHGYPTPDDALFTDAATFQMFVDRTATSIDTHVTPDPNTEELFSEPLGVWRPDVDYLVEPAADGFALAGLPGAAAPVVCDLDTVWPNAHAIGLEIRAGDGPPIVRTPSSSEAAVTAYVPKGVTRTVQASIAGKKDLALHWAALHDRPTDEREMLQGQFESGQHWMFAVPQPLTLVHAVRRPLLVPSIVGTPVASRGLGSTRCRLDGTFVVDVKSTGRLEVSGTWTDRVDADGAVPRRISRLLFTQSFGYDENQTAPIGPGFEVGDTKRHEALVWIEAFSRYSRYFTERTTVRFTAPGQTVRLYPLPIVPVPGATVGIAELNVAVAIGETAVTQGFSIDADLGTITHLAGGSLPLDTDIDVDFIRLPINRRSDETGSGTFAVLIPNSAVPDVPLVDEVLPAFARDRFADDDSLIVSHDGQIVRVWLRRPWFTTGDKELLGVLVGDSDDGPTSQAARDPLSTTGPPSPLIVDDFPNATVTRRVRGVDVAGHEVQFDEASDRWFVDIAIGGGIGYRPFVKLALVRFQPDSIPGAFISEPVLTEPIRLGSVRQATVDRDGTDLQVVVYGDGFQGFGVGNVVTVQFQVADPDISDPDLRWTDIGSPVELDASPEGDSAETRWSGTLTPPIDNRPIRIVIEDAEQLTQQTATGPRVVDSVAYVETIEIPTEWTAPAGSAPGAPSAVAASPQHQAVTVSWTAPADGGSPILSSTVERRVGTGAWGDAVVVAPPGTSVLIDGLTNGVQYGFRVRAENAAGIGPWSGEVTAIPAPTAPAQVGPLQVQGGHRSALVSWPAPADTGSPITGLRVERREGAGVWANGVDLVAGSTRYIARGLTNGTPYQFRVRASNALGDGAWSDPAAVTPDVMVPGRVRRVIASSGGGLVELRWRSAAERGAPVLEYQIERRAAPGGDWGTQLLVNGDETNRSIAGLAPGSAWEFRVRARNSVGVGAWSPPVGATVDAAGVAPGQVGGVAVEPDDGALTVTWLEPDDGGSPVLAYAVQRRLDGGTWGPITNVASEQLVHRYDGLVNGSVYGVRVRAVNAVGPGEWSTEVLGSPAP